MTAVVSRFTAPSQTFILRKLVGLRSSGVKVQVASSTFTEQATATGFDLLPLLPWADLGHPRRTAPAWTPVAAELWRSRADGRAALRERATLAPLLAAHSDIVHFEFSSNAVTYRHLLDRLRPARLVVSCRGAAEQIVPREDPSRIPQLAQVFDTVDLVHCVSDDIRATVIELGADPAKILVNRPAVPVADFAPLAADRSERDDGVLRVLSIGRLHWKKGLDDGLRAVDQLVRRGQRVEYRIVGEGAEREKLTFMIGELGLGAVASLLGARTEAEVREQLRWADVLLLPSWSEGISNAVLESMAAGLPVVVTECGGMREVVTDGADGFVVPIGDTDTMADVLAQLAGDQDLRVRIGAAASERAAVDFDISRQVDRFVGAYRSLVERGGGSRNS